MSTGSNKAVIRRYCQIHNFKNLDDLGDVLPADFRPHTVPPLAATECTGFTIEE